jgi:hypothetical protein
MQVKISQYSGAVAASEKLGLRMGYENPEKQVTVRQHLKAAGESRPNTTPHKQQPAIRIGMKILVLNPGGNSLKAEIVECRAEQQYAFEGCTLLSISIEGIGKTPEISLMRGKEKTATEPIPAENYEQAADSFLSCGRENPILPNYHTPPIWK